MDLNDLYKDLNIPEPSKEHKQDIENVINARRKMAYAVIQHLPSPLDERRGTFHIRKMHGDLCELLLLGFVGPALTYCGPFLEHVLEDAILYAMEKRFKRNLTTKEERAIEKGSLGGAINKAGSLGLLVQSEIELLKKFEIQFRHSHQHGSLAAMVRGVRLKGHIRV